LPIPKTVYFTVDSLQTIAMKQLAKYGLEFPLIVKSNDGSRGSDNYLCKNIKEIHNIAKESLTLPQPKEYIVEEYIPNDGDYRILYIGLSHEPFVFKRIASKGSHLNNTSKGGGGIVVDNATLPKVFFKDAKKAAKAVSCDIVGIDIIVNSETGKHYILEANSTPALATGFNVTEKTKKFATFVKNHKKTNHRQMSTIGRVEKIDLPKFKLEKIPAKIDSGADLSVISVHNIIETKKGLSFVLFDKNYKYYTGEKIFIPKPKYKYSIIYSSFGHKELRYQIKLGARIDGRLIKGTFTLADRSHKIYPILIGRKILYKKFLVDVSKGKPLIRQEKIQKNKLKKELDQLKG
jgi:hypothetical protein